MTDHTKFFEILKTIPPQVYYLGGLKEDIEIKDFWEQLFLAFKSRLEAEREEKAQEFRKKIMEGVQPYDGTGMLNKFAQEEK